MRTDSPKLSVTALDAARHIVSTEIGQDFLGPKPAITSPSLTTAIAVDGMEDKGAKKSRSKKEKDDEVAIIRAQEVASVDVIHADGGMSPIAQAGAAAASAAAPKNAQEAHEAIRPVEVDGRFRTPEETGLEGERINGYSF